MNLQAHYLLFSIFAFLSTDSLRFQGLVYFKKELLPQCRWKNNVKAGEKFETKIGFSFCLEYRGKNPMNCKLPLKAVLGWQQGGVEG